MNKHFFKHIRDNIPEPVKYLSAPLFRNKLLFNKNFKDYYSFLKESEKFSYEETKNYQLEQLRNILNFAYKNIPYYTDLFNKVDFDCSQFSSFDDMNKIPVLTKNIIRENFDKLISNQKVRGGYYVATTGGTTGEPLKVLLDYNSIFKENAFVYYFRNRFKYNFNDKIVTFRGVEFNDKLWKFNPMHNELIFSPFKLSPKTLPKYLKQINKFKPAFLNGYLSTLTYFSKLLSDKNLQLKYPLKGIFLISENVDKEKRNFIENFFNVKSFAFYGHSERCIFAEELEPYKYAFNPYYGFTEFLSNKDSSYTIVGTGFLNRTMPLIRYQTDDACIKNDKSYNIYGRWKTNHGLYGLNDEFFAHAAFNFHSDIFKNVISYQFIQNKKGEADLLLIVNSNFKLSEIEAMKKEINKKTRGVIKFNIKITEQLILSKRGKFNRIVSEIN